MLNRKAGGGRSERWGFRLSQEKEEKEEYVGVYGSVSPDPVLVPEPLAQLVEVSVVPESVGGPISISAVSVAVCTDDRDNVLPESPT